MGPMAVTETVAAAGREPLAHSLLRYGRSFGVGSAFAVGWTPCIGPILGAILTLAASSATVVKGAFLLSVWSLGLGLPFLVAGLALGRAMAAIRKLRPVMPVLEVLGGSLVIVVGILIFLDRFTIFNTYFSGGVTRVTGAESGLDSIEVGGPLGFAAAFGAGVIAFLSPCCLPLVPAYLAHLAGVSTEAGSLEINRGLTFRHALAFVLGFSAVFVIIGASVGAAGYAVRDNLPTLEKIAGVVLIVMGLNLIGVIRIPWLYRSYQIEFPAAPPSADKRESVTP
jgi:cytochrome c biogenesis protein CcdA